MPDRYARQHDLVPQARLADLDLMIVGVGAVGRQLALQLAALGARRLTIIDHDDVEATNITTQAYFASDLGLPKVLATQRVINQIDREIVVTPIPDRYRSKHGSAPAVFCAVDSIAARKAIWRAVGSDCRFWGDARMLGEVLRLLTAADAYGRDHYPTTLFDPADAQLGRCTAQSTIYTANIAAGLLLHQFTRWLRGLPTDRDQTINLLAGEWSLN